MTTFTPDITAPLASRTVPVICPVAVCAAAVDVMIANAASIALASVRIGLRLIAVPPVDGLRGRLRMRTSREERAGPAPLVDSQKVNRAPSWMRRALLVLLV